MIDACRAGLPDLRLVDAGGREVPYALEGASGLELRRFAVENLERREHEETDAEIDRGPQPGLADAVTFEIGGAEFLKPVRVEASEDRASWKEIARASLFAAGGVRMTSLPLPPTDRRYLRFRFDDRNGDPIPLEAVRLRASAPEPPVAARPLPLQRVPADGDASAVARYSGALPASNLDLAAVRFSAKNAAFSRPVRVFERVLFRDEVCRRLVAWGTISRTPGGPEALDVPLAGVTGRQLEIEIDGGDSPDLEDLAATALVRPRFLRFDAPAGTGLRLLFGSSEAAAPRYDLARSLAGTPDTAPPLARLGPTSATGSAAGPAAAPRVPLPDPEKWVTRRPLRLAGGGGVAYLDLYDVPGGFADARIVDAAGRQVPFIVEGGAHGHREPAAWNEESAGRITAVAIPAPAHADAVVEIELRADAPDYFSREVRVEQERRDARGPLAPATLGAARWERRPGDAALLRLPVARPEGAGAIRVEIDNGDNAPVRISGVSLRRAVSRIDFVYGPDDRLFLYSGNPDARRPVYDLDLVAGAVLASPARAASLGPAPEAPETRAPLGRWIWGAVAVTILVLIFELARSLPRRA